LPGAAETFYADEYDPDVATYSDNAMAGNTHDRPRRGG
jgi:hypothetical protein